MNKFLKASLPVVLAAAVVAVSFVGYTPRDVYAAAVEAMKQGDYEMARSHLERLDSAEAENLLDQLYFVPNKVATTYADGTTQLQSYAYNRKGCMVKAELTENEQVVSTSSYAYTSEGAMLSMNLMLPEQEKPETTLEYFYDQLGHLTCSRTVGDEGLFYQTQYTYDQTGKCVESFYVNGNGAWERTEFTYDEADRLVVQTVKTDEETKWSTTRYEYHENGQKKAQRTSGPEGVTTHTFDEEGRLLKVVATDSEGDRQTETYIYDQQGNLTQVAYSNGRKVVYHYNKSGQLLSCRDEKTPEDWVETVQEYQDGNLVKRQVNAANQDTYTEVFKYNKKDLCVSYQYKNDTTGEWYKYAYTYDRHGNVEKETYEAAQGSYERTYKWKTRHYPEGIPQMVQDVMEEYEVKKG